MKKITALLLCLLSLSACSRAQTIDTSTGSAWMGKYGANGYQIPLGVSSLQTTATVTVTGDSTWTWATGFTCWYSPSSFTINVNITDGKTHQVALWSMDYDKQGRSETIQLAGASQPISGFTAGVYT